MSVAPRPPYRVLVMAKAPLPGRVKTRLGARVGDRVAAEVAAAALLDTLEAATAAVGPQGCVLALDGTLDDAVDGERLRAAVAGWQVVAQQGDGFAARLVHAHAACGEGVVVQVGMDTPHVTPARLDAAAAPLLAPGVEDGPDVVLGPALDGGWWVLARRDPAATAVLGDVAMSTDRTGDDTRAALEAAGWRVGATEALRDVDEVDDADAVAAEAPASHFAHAWQRAAVAAGEAGR